MDSLAIKLVHVFTVLSGLGRRYGVTAKHLSHIERTIYWLRKDGVVKAATYLTRYTKSTREDFNSRDMDHIYLAAYRLLLRAVLQAGGDVYQVYEDSGIGEDTWVPDEKDLLKSPKERTTPDPDSRFAELNRLCAEIESYNVETEKWLLSGSRPKLRPVK
jgi:hypothetical protein